MSTPTLADPDPTVAQAPTPGHAPVAVMAYRRPQHLDATLQALLLCPEAADSDIHVFVDGPKGEADRAEVQATRDVARRLLGERATYHFAQTNQGLARSIIGAVTSLSAAYGRVIVLEDDIVVAPITLTYLNAALARYQDDPRVMQVSAHMFDNVPWADGDPALMLPFTTSWGWATWERAWRQFDPLAIGWEGLATDKALRRSFNLSGVYDFASMLERQMRGLRDSWAIRWYWSVYRAGGMVLYPPRSLVSNTGFDGSGTHGRALLRRFGSDGSSPAAPPALPRWPELVQVNDADMRAVCRAIRKSNGGWTGWLVDRLRHLIGR
ncbi:hypothetical protein KAK06_05175 [Ideonella sp. 4Y11]|uniref:Glycosyltransferase n=1 Tax=Ideonella aquatica TaxID=2824119 RepID=A0A940YJS7_9BURK|nr:hypothetical protein [Ideonella aquatica]MBQ0958342.1 hypothetical protein [Ideonella aquatica]